MRTLFSYFLPILFCAGLRAQPELTSDTLLGRFHGYMLNRSDLLAYLADTAAFNQKTIDAHLAELQQSVASVREWYALYRELTGSDSPVTLSAFLEYDRQWREYLEQRLRSARQWTQLPPISLFFKVEKGKRISGVIDKSAPREIFEFELIFRVQRTEAKLWTLEIIALKTNLPDDRSMGDLRVDAFPMSIMNIHLSPYTYHTYLIQGFYPENAMKLSIFGLDMEYRKDLPVLSWDFYRWRVNPYFTQNDVFYFPNLEAVGDALQKANAKLADCELVKRIAQAGK